MTQNEVLNILQIIPEKEKGHLYAFFETAEGWKRVSECESLKKAPRVQPMFLPPLPKVPVADKNIEEAVEQLGYQRKHLRIEKSIGVKIENADNSFETQTVNISRGGLMLHDAMPEWAFGYFTVSLEIIDGKFLKIICTAAEDQAYEKKRLVIADNNRPEIMKIYNLWIDKTEEGS